MIQLAARFWFWFSFLVGFWLHLIWLWVYLFLLWVHYLWLIVNLRCKTYIHISDKISMVITMSSLSFEPHCTIFTNACHWHTQDTHSARFAVHHSRLVDNILAKHGQASITRTKKHRTQNAFHQRRLVFATTNSKLQSR